MENQKKKKHMDQRTFFVRIVAIVLVLMIVGSAAAFAFMH